MRFLSKIRERQFAKKCGGAYNLSRAVLAGVLAAGCLMPGFAEAAPGLVTNNGNSVEINGGTITRDVYGGESYSDTANLNIVSIIDGTFNNYDIDSYVLRLGLYLDFDITPLK